MFQVIIEDVKAQKSGSPLWMTDGRFVAIHVQKEKTQQGSSKVILNFHN